MNYKSYPKAKTTPNRRIRKGERNVIFLFNRKARKTALKLRRAMRVTPNE